MQKEIAKWYPRRHEYEKYIRWDQDCPEKYTRNLVYSNEHMDVLLMCWPAGSESSIHCHDNSSCWVALVEGTVQEFLYSVPVVDRRFQDQVLGLPVQPLWNVGD